MGGGGWGGGGVVYIVGFMVRNFVLRRRVAVKVISDHKTEDIPPEMKILNTVIPILMYF